MTPDIVVHGFETSNNMKVRIALGYKGLSYAFRTIDPADRGELARISGQHLTPVLVHDGRVLCDSAAILRYLDANFRATPRLFGTSRDEQWEIEDHEMFARTALSGPMLALVHRRVQGVEIDPALASRCADDFAAAVATIRERLAGRRWLVGDAMTAADVTTGAVLFRVRHAELLPWPDPEGALRPYEDAVMAFDGPGRVDG